MHSEKETFNKLKEPAPVIDEYGTKRWYNEKGELHSDNDLPAIVWADGASTRWYKNGKLHRENDRPAVISKKVGFFSWYKNGLLHRYDGPAIIYSNGKTEWYINGDIYHPPLTL